MDATSLSNANRVVLPDAARELRRHIAVLDAQLEIALSIPGREDLLRPAVLAQLDLVTSDLIAIRNLISDSFADDLELSLPASSLNIQ